MALQRRCRLVWSTQLVQHGRSVGVGDSPAPGHRRIRPGGTRQAQRVLHRWPGFAPWRLAIAGDRFFICKAGVLGHGQIVRYQGGQSRTATAPAAEGSIAD